MLENCLSSLAFTCGTLPEIVVVDNANQASTRKLVAEYANAKYVATTENLGFAGGNNVGFPLCTREYVLLLNNDTIIREEPFSKLIDYLEAHHHVAVVQGKMRLARLDDALDSCGEMLTPFGVGFDGYVHRSCLNTVTPSHPVYFAKGALLMMRRSIVDKLGGCLFYDFFLNNYEEADFCFRVWLTGYEVHYVDTPPIDHLQGQSVKKRDQTEMNGRSLANMWFSLSANLSVGSRLKILPRLFVLESLIFVAMLLTGRWRKLPPYFFAVREVYRRRGLLRAKREYVRTIRKQSDADVFKSIMVRPRLSYYYYLIRGDAESYKRGDLNAPEGFCFAGFQTPKF